MSECVCKGEGVSRDRKEIQGEEIKRERERERAEGERERGGEAEAEK